MKYLLASILSIATMAAAPPASAEDAEPPLRISARVTPPITRITSTQHGDINVGFGGVALGVTTPESLWLEGSASLLLGLEGGGYDGSLSAGYAFHDTPRKHAWSLQAPLFASYRYAKRPSSSPTDGYTANETMHMVGLGGRIVLVRTLEANAFELGVGVSAMVPVSSERKGGIYFSDEKTKVWVDATLTLGWSFGI